MANPIPLRPWSRLGSLRSHEPEPEPSLKATNTYHQNNQSVTKSLPTPPHVHNPNQSPKPKLTTPITFPPSKLKVHSHINEKPNGNCNDKEESGETQKHVTKKENETKGKDIHTKLSGSEGIRVITISGENRGAYMQITKSQKKPNHKSEKAMYVNSNVQCVNNSMVFNTSLSHHDPGVHLIIPKKPLGKGLHLKERVDSQRN